MQGISKKYQFLNNKVTFSLLLSNNRNIRKLNKNFRNKNKSTDILSFPWNTKLEISKKTYLGDIIISYNFLDQPNLKNSETFEQRVAKIFIHGFLHLLGFDHKKKDEYDKMLREEKLLYKLVKPKIN